MKCVTENWIVLNMLNSTGIGEIRHARFYAEGIETMPRKSLTAEQRARIVDEYAAGSTTTALAAKYDLSNSFVLRLIISAGVPIHPKSHHSKLGVSGHEAMERSYASGMTTYQVADKYGIKACSAWEYLNRRGLTRDAKDNARRYAYNDLAFDEITPESAYWLGFLMTDGCVTDAPHALAISLQAADKSHLEKFQNFIGSEHPIKDSIRRCSLSTDGLGTPRSACHFKISTHLFYRLCSYGVVPRKTKIAKAIGVEMNPHFWRGAIDGDGSVMLVERDGKLQPIVRLCSASLMFMQQFQNFAREICPKSWSKVGPLCKSTYSIAVGGSFAIDLLRILYDGIGPSLDRKQATANQIFALVNADPLWQRRKGKHSKRPKAQSV